MSSYSRNFYNLVAWNIVLAFLGDPLVLLGKDFEDHLTNLRSVFASFREFDLKVKPKKYAFFRRRVEFPRVWKWEILMWKPSGTGTGRIPVLIKIGKVFGFYQLPSRLDSWLRSIGNTHLPLDREETFHQGAGAANCFDALKKALMSPLVLAIPEQDGEFALDTVFSAEAIGTELSLIQHG